MTDNRQKVFVKSGGCESTWDLKMAAIDTSDSEDYEGFYPSDLDDILLENIGSDISVSSVSSADLETSDLEDELVDNLGDTGNDGWQNYCTRTIHIGP